MSLLLPVQIMRCVKFFWACPGSKAAGSGQRFKFSPDYRLRAFRSCPSRARTQGLSGVAKIFSTGLGLTASHAYYVERYATEKSANMEDSIIFIPSSEREAMQWLIPALDLPLTTMPMDEFMKAWHAIAYLYGGLHPDAATDHGEKIANNHEGPERFNLIEPRLIGPYYVQSGWPMVLAPLAEEAWRRYEAGRLEEDEFYCYHACKAGIVARMGDDTGLVSTFMND